MAIHHEIDTPLAKACRIIGGQSALSRLIGKHQTTIHERLRDGKPLWAEDVLAVEAATGISKHELRPDLYPPEEYAQSPDPQAGEASPAGSSKAAGDAVPHRQACA